MPDKTQPLENASGETEQVRMTFGQHLEELRKRLLKAAFGLLIGMGLCMAFTQEIIGFLVSPYIYALKENAQSSIFQTTSPAEFVLQYLGIGFKAGLIVSAPWIIYQIWQFIGAGLYKKEKRLVYKYLGPAIILFFVGVAFFYFIILPLTLKFLVEFSNSTRVATPKASSVLKLMGGEGHNYGINPATLPSGDKVTPFKIPIVTSDPPVSNPPDTMNAEIWYNFTEKEVRIRMGTIVLTPIVNNVTSQFMPFPKLGEYLGFVLFMGLMFGVCFELPMIMLILSKLRMVKVKTWREKRKIAWFVISIAAAIMAASPDIFSMMSLMVPLVALYEVGIIVAAIGVRDQPQDEEPEEPEQAQ